MRYGRFLANPKVKVNELIEYACAPLSQRVQGRHLLLIQDTTEINLQKHLKRVEGLGVVGNGKDVGFFVHPLLGVDAQDGACLGLAHITLWQRQPTETKTKKYQTLPIEQKESYRWIKTVEQAKARVEAAQLCTVVADREADIYELFDRLPDEHTHLLIRASYNRLLINEGKKLFEWLDEQPIEHSYKLHLNKTTKRSPHQALMHVRFGEVSLKKSTKCIKADVSNTVKVNVVDVREDASTVKEGEAPIHWRLITTHQVVSPEQACQCIEWYRQRWHIEQVFRTVKKQGLNMESSLLEKAERLEKMAVLALSSAVHVMQLIMARDGSSRSMYDTFEREDKALVKQLSKKLEGKTQKQKNPHPIESLAWASWVVARLGGWKGYASERKPGPITMLNGLTRYHDIKEGWMLLQDQLNSI